MGKTSLANTFAEFLKSPTEDSKAVLTKGTDLEFTKVMQLYDGLSVNQKKEIEVKVENLPRNRSVKLVKLKMDRDEGKDNASFHLASSVATETTGSKEVKGGESTSAPKKAGKREQVKRIFTSLFTRANDESMAAEEDKEKEESEDDVEMTNRNQGTKSPGETSDAESPSRSENDNKNDVQLKLVDMGGHSATVVLTTAVNSSNQFVCIVNLCKPIFKPFKYFDTLDHLKIYKKNPPEDLKKKSPEIGHIKIGYFSFIAISALEDVSTIVGVLHVKLPLHVIQWSVLDSDGQQETPGVQ